MSHMAQNQPKLQFADPPTSSRLTNGTQFGSNQWMGHCPCHDDRVPSLSIRWGRKRGCTVVQCKAGCPQKDVIAWFRKQGYWLNRDLGERKPKRRRINGARLDRSLALAVLTKSERLMFDVILAGDSPTYDDFEAMGIRHAAISPGLRVLEALGLIGPSASRSTGATTDTTATTTTTTTTTGSRAAGLSSNRRKTGLRCKHFGLRWQTRVSWREQQEKQRSAGRKRTH
jgi:hypothetical protein